MAKGLRERRVTSAGNVFHKQILPTGQVVYRKNGRFAKKRQWAAALAHTTERQSDITLRVEDTAQAPPTPISEDFAYTDPDGNWRAGPRAAEILPYVTEGEFISGADLTEIRKAGAQEMGFISFWNIQDPNMSAAEAKLAFDSMIFELMDAADAAERDDIRESYGLSRYET